MALRHGVLASKMKFKNLLLQNHLAQMIEIWYIALLDRLLPVPKKVPGFKVALLKNLLLQKHLAQMLEIWYVALPSGLLPSLFKLRLQGPKIFFRTTLLRCLKQKSQGPRWPCTRGSKVLTIEIHKIFKVFFFRTTMLRCLKFNM